MILQIQHETRLEYSDPIAEWLTEVRMEPASDEEQRCHSFHLTVSQPTSLFRYHDGFGNRVHHFNLLDPHQQVRMLAASVVTTGVRIRDLVGSRSTYPLACADMPADNFTYLGWRGPVRRSALLEPVLQALAPTPGQRLVDWLATVNAFIYEQFEYAPDVTN